MIYFIDYNTVLADKDMCVGYVYKTVVTGGCCSDPNGEGVPLWPEYTSAHPRYLEFRGAQPSSFAVLDTFRDDYCRLWADINRQLQETAAAEDSKFDPLMLL